MSKCYILAKCAIHRHPYSMLCEILTLENRFSWSSCVWIPQHHNSPPHCGTAKLSKVTIKLVLRMCRFPGWCSLPPMFTQPKCGERKAWPNTDTVTGRGLANQKVTRKLPESYQKFTRKIPKNYQKIIRRLWESYNKVARKFPESFQKISSKLPESSQKFTSKVPEIY